MPVAAHSLREGRRALTRRRIQVAYDGFESPMHARMLAREVDVPDSRLSRNGDGAVPAMRTVCQSVGERWRDSASSLAIKGYPATRMLAHKLARVVDPADFRLSRNGNGAEAAGAHSLRAGREAIVRRRRLNAYLGFPVAPICVGARWM